MRSQQMLADEVGVSREAVSLWETNMTTPAREKVTKLCNLLGPELTIRDFMFDPDEAHEASPLGDVAAFTFTQFAVEDRVDGEPEPFIDEPDEYEHQQRLIEQYRQHIPVDVAGLARELGIDVYTKQYNGDESGEIRLGEDGYEIYVNKFHSRGRQRFTIGHEIGHFMKHRHLIGEGIIDGPLYRSLLPDPIEWEANRFSSNLLMPRKILSEIFGKIGDVEKTARHFEVSVTAMKIALGAPDD